MDPRYLDKITDTIVHLAHERGCSLVIDEVIHEYDILCNCEKLDFHCYSDKLFGNWFFQYESIMGQRIIERRQQVEEYNKSQSGMYGWNLILILEKENEMSKFVYGNGGRCNGNTEAQKEFVKSQYPKINIDASWQSIILNTTRPEIKKVIFSGPVTVVKWTDGTLTKCRAMEGETVDKEKGLALCIAKKYFKTESNSQFKKIMDKWIPKEEEAEAKEKTLMSSSVTFPNGMKWGIKSKKKKK